MEVNNWEEIVPLPKTPPILMLVLCKFIFELVSFSEKCNIYICNFHIPYLLLLIKRSVYFTKPNFMSAISHQDFL